MNINFTNTSIGMQTQGISRQDDIGLPVENANTASSKTSSAFRVTEAPVEELRGSEPVTAIPASVLTRDDDLGRFVNSVFNFAPPPMPDFTI